MRVNAYIDGWNLYNAELKLEDYRLEWLNLRALCQHFCNEDDILNAVYYFTAYEDRKKSLNSGSDRHKIYIDEFLKDFDVEPKFGYMSKFEGVLKEKYTDVNLALQVFEDAMYDRFDKAILLSADTDFIPVIERVQKLNKDILLLIPPKSEVSDRFYSVINDKNVNCINENDLATHLLPVESKNGVKMPRQYLSKTKQAREQTEEFTKKLKYTSWNPTLCEKCKDYLRYESYDKLKQNRR